jgi:quercetin dioxygenase-like cupin family protein
MAHAPPTGSLLPVGSITAAKERKEQIMASAEQKQFSAPDETRTFEKGQVDLLNIGNGVVGRLTLQPGWRWSQHVKPLAGTEWCEAPHFQYHVSGTLHVVMSDGSEFDVRPGEVTALPSGHDAWVVGDEPAVIVDFFGASNSAMC